VIVVEQDTWVTLLGFAGFAVALFGYLGAIRRDLRFEIGACRSELKAEIGAFRSELKAEIRQVSDELRGTDGRLSGQIADLRREMKGEFAKVDARLTTLEQRTYDLSTRLPARPA
jgi:hypothetical protein